MGLIEEEGHRLKLVINIVVLALALRGVSRFELNKSETSIFENLMIDSIGPMQSSVIYVKRKVSETIEHYFLNVNSSQENVRLRKEIEELKSEIFHFTEISRENIRLKELLQFGQDTASKKVLAQIVAWDASSDFRVLRINKGTADGLKLQSTVVTAQGLVGHIYRLTNHFADVLTILDSDNRVDGIVKRIRSYGIIEGHSGNRCLMKYVTRSEPVIIGDVVLTSGLGNVYPKGIVIGTISRIERESYGITQYIELTPSVDFGRIEEVVVLISPDDKLLAKEWDVLDNPAEER